MFIPPFRLAPMKIATLSALPGAHQPIAIAIPDAKRVDGGRGQTDDSLCPSFSFFVFKYRRVDSDAGISSGIHSQIDSP